MIDTLEYLVWGSSWLKKCNCNLPPSVIFLLIQPPLPTPKAFLVEGLACHYLHKMPKTHKVIGLWIILTLHGVMKKYKFWWFKKCNNYVVITSINKIIINAVSLHLFFAGVLKIATHLPINCFTCLWYCTDLIMSNNKHLILREIISEPLPLLTCSLTYLTWEHVVLNSKGKWQGEKGHDHRIEPAFISFRDDAVLLTMWHKWQLKSRYWFLYITAQCPHPM